MYELVELASSIEAFYNDGVQLQYANMLRIFSHVQACALIYILLVCLVSIDSTGQISIGIPCCEATVLYTNPQVQKENLYDAFYRLTNTRG